MCILSVYVVLKSTITKITTKEFRCFEIILVKKTHTNVAESKTKWQMDVSEGGRPSGIWNRYLSEVPAISIFIAVKHNFSHAIPALIRTYVSDCTAIITVARFSNLTDYEAATSTREKPNYTANCPQYNLTVDACVSPVLHQQFPLLLPIRLFNFSLFFIFRAFFCDNRLESNFTARIMWRIKNIHVLIWIETSRSATMYN